jgi:hypothetical protein
MHLFAVVLFVVLSSVACDASATLLANRRPASCDTSQSQWATSLRCSASFNHGCTSFRESFLECEHFCRGDPCLESCKQGCAFAALNVFSILAPSSDPHNYLEVVRIFSSQMNLSVPLEQLVISECSLAPAVEVCVESGLSLIVAADTCEVSCGTIMFTKLDTHSCSIGCKFANTYRTQTLIQSASRPMGDRRRSGTSSGFQEPF